MAGETQVTVVGNLTDDPELKFTPSGAAVANFTVAQTPRTYDKNSNEWVDGETNYFRCAVWRQPAENVAESLSKGMRVVVTGALKIRNFERQDGSKGTSVEVNVDEVGPSLRYASAKVTKVQRSGGQNQGQSAPQQQGGANPWSTQPQGSQGGNAWGSSQDEPPF